MYRTALRAASRPVVGGLRSTALRAAAPRRLASTNVPAEKPKSWKGSALRLGLAFAAVYYYNTSPVFADEATAQTVPPPAAFSQDDVPTVDSVLAEKRKQIQARPEPAAVETSSTTTPKKPAEETDAAPAEGSPAALEAEAGQQGAFNPETGEINWDCPCLGGMADGPCGEDFKTAFSCFVYSTEEPKGMDCIEKFQGMQECFKKYPEIYGAELADDDEDAAAAAPEGDAAAAPLADAAQESTAPAELPAESVAPKEEEERIVVQPKKAEDATDVNVEEKQVVPKEVEPKVEENKAEKAVQA